MIPQNTVRKGQRLFGLMDDLQESLPSQKVIDAVDSRVVAADVAANAGVSLAQARRDLQALAAVSQADMAVNADGELIYTFPPNLKGVLASKSRRYRALQLARKVWPALFWGIRVSFGLLLLVSVAAIFSTILFIQTSSSDERRDDRRGGVSFGGGGSFGGPFGSFWGPSPFDFFYYRPYGYYGGYYGGYKDPDEMGLLESIFSYIFGDGNPNADLEEERTRLAARVIRENGGAVTAEQLAPFCDDLPSPSEAESATVNESYVLPLVTALNGQAQVTEDGIIVYTFPELQVSAAGGDSLVLKRAGLKADASTREISRLLQANGINTRGALERADLIRTLEKYLPEENGDVLLEREYEFSLAPETNRYIAGGLGILNLGGALYLGNLLGQAALYGVRLPSYMGLVQAGYPLLLAYAILFNVIPLTRNFLIGKSNEEIRERNNRRRQWRKALASALTTGSIGRKIRAARKMKTSMKQLGTGGDDILYDTSKANIENKEKKEQSDLDEFDRLLRESQDKDFQ